MMLGSIVLFAQIMPGGVQPAAVPPSGVQAPPTNEPSAQVPAPPTNAQVPAPPTSAPSQVTPMTAPPPQNWQAPALAPLVQPYVPERPGRLRSELLVELAGAAYYDRLFSVQAYGGEGRLAIGSGSEKHAFAFSLDYGGGQTFHGLGMRTWRIGWSWDWIFDRVRVGLEPTLGYTGLARATNSYWMEQGFLGLDAHVSFDLVPFFTRSALFVRAAVNVDGPTWGPSLWLGFRFEGPLRNMTPRPSSDDY